MDYQSTDEFFNIDEIHDVAATEAIDANVEGEDIALKFS